MGQYKKKKMSATVQSSEVINVSHPQWKAAMMHLQSEPRYSVIQKEFYLSIVK